LRLLGVTWIAACGGDEDFDPFASTTAAQPTNITTGANNKMAGNARHCHNCRTLQNVPPRNCLGNFQLRKVIEVTALQLLRKESGVRVRTKILLTLITSSALKSASRPGPGVGPLKLKQMLSVLISVERYRGNRQLNYWFDEQFWGNGPEFVARHLWQWTAK